MKYLLEIATQAALHIEADDDAQAADIIAALRAKRFAGLPLDTYVAVIDEAGNRWVTTFQRFTHE